MRKMKDVETAASGVRDSGVVDTFVHRDGPAVLILMISVQRVQPDGENSLRVAIYVPAAAKQHENTVSGRGQDTKGKDPKEADETITSIIVIPKAASYLRPTGATAPWANTLYGQAFFCTVTVGAPAAA